MPATEMRTGHEFMTSDTIKLPEFQSKLRESLYVPTTLLT